MEIEMKPMSKDFIVFTELGKAVQEIDRLQAERNDWKARCEAAEAEVAKLSKACNTFVAALKKAAGEIEAAEKDRDLSEFHRSELVAANDNAHDQITRLRESLDEYLTAQSRMADRWADGDPALKSELWRDLHACENPARAILKETSL